MKTLPRIVFLLIAFWSPSSSAEWYYTNLLSDRAIEIVLRKDSVRAHSNEPAITCPAKSAYFCIRSSTFAFAVPKKLGAERQWTVNDGSFRVAAERKIYVLGKMHDLILIEEVKQNESGLRFLYSRQRGLVGLWSPKAESPSLFMLQNVCGFAAPPTCK